MKQLIKRIPVIGEIARHAYRRLLPARYRENFPGSGQYWEQRYAAGGSSGAGSYGKLAQFKAEVINAFIARHAIGSVIEFGCGDGNQLRLAHYPMYHGFDVSETALAHCRKLFAGDPGKTFDSMSMYRDRQADLALSLDVIYHLVEDRVFEEYMRTLFGAARRHVLIYSSNRADDSALQSSHVRQRRFTDWIQKSMPGWRLFEHVPNRYPYIDDEREGSFAEFFAYERNSTLASEVQVANVRITTDPSP